MAILWAIWNWIQFLAALAWTATWITIAMVVLILTWRPNIPLHMARRIWAPGALRIAGGKVTVTYDDDLDWSAPHVFVCNHQSMLDIPAVFLALRTPLRFMAKRSLGHIPFLGWYMRATGMVLVDRSNPQAMIRSLNRQGTQLRERRQSLLVFPEGTRSRTGGIGSFKSGAFILAINTGVPVVPVTVDGSRHVMVAGRVEGRPGPIHVRVGAPVLTERMTPADRDRLSKLVRSKMIEMMRPPTLDDASSGQAPVSVEQTAHRQS